MGYCWKRTTAGVITFLLILSFFIVIVVSIKDKYYHNQLMMKECIADGNKVYECNSMIYGGY